MADPNDLQVLCIRFAPRQIRFLDHLARKLDTTRSEVLRQIVDNTRVVNCPALGAKIDLDRIAEQIEERALQ